MIDINLPKLIPQTLIALVGDEFAQAVLDDLAALARAKWIRLAQQSLHSSKRDYIAGIQPVMTEGNTRVITLVGQLANMVEQGADAWDLRETLLQGQGVKTNAEGQRYRAIPFRHGTPGSAGSTGTPMGRRYGPQGPQSRAWAASGHFDQGQAAKLGKAVYAAAKALKQRQRLGGGKRTIVDMGQNKLRVPKLAPWHSTDIYAGMRKERKTYKKATQTQYTTFRTISEANPEGWIHPGIQGRHLAQQVEQHVEGMIGKVVSNAITRAFGKVASK